MGSGICCRGGRSATDDSQGGWCGSRRTIARRSVGTLAARSCATLVDRGEKVFPIANVMRVSDEVSDRQFPGRSRFLFQLDTLLFRQPVALDAIDALIGQHAVLPTCLAAARPRHHMIDISLDWNQLLAAVLAT